MRVAILAQVFGTLIAVGLVALLYRKLFAMPLAVACLQGLCAALVSFKLEAPPWWLAIHLVFMPLAILVSGLGFSPAWYLGAFILLLLIFWRTDQSRVPLYLSNKATTTAVAKLIPAEPCRFVDLGCGTGTLIKQLALARPDCHFVGIEHAPLPWLWARLSALGIDNCQIKFGDFWKHPVNEFRVVYAFLSPAPMPKLWAKAHAEMAAGSLLISSSFEIPDISPVQTIRLDDRRATRLYCYRPGD
jgi:hypothetical protein